MTSTPKPAVVPRPPITWLVWAAWVTLSLAAAFFFVGSWLNSGSVLYGVCTLLAYSWVVLSLTTIYVGATGRPSWMRLRSARFSALPVAALGAVAFILMGVLNALLTSS